MVGYLIAEKLLFWILIFIQKEQYALFFFAYVFSTLDSLQHMMICGLIFYSNITAGTLRDFLPTHAPCLKDMRGQKMLWTSWDPCWIGKLLFSCSVPSLSTTLPTQKGATTDQIQWNGVNTYSHTCYTKEDGFKLYLSIAELKLPLKKEWLALTDLYSSSLLTQALISREGSLASRLIQDRADMLQMELPSLTTRRLALVSFPVGGGESAETYKRLPSQPETQISAWYKN